MKYAVINDQHFGVNGDSEFFAENYAEFYHGVFHPALKEHDINTVIVAGDFWQSRKNINPLTLRRAQEMFFDPLMAAGIRVIMSYGNHDVYYKNTNTVNSIDFLGEMYPGVEIVEEYKELDGGVLLVSWICPENAERIFSALENTTCPYLIGHFEIEGHQMTPGHVCTHGLSKSVFSKFKRVLSGHFHVRGNDGKIFYTSNPSQTSWADYGLEKGFHIFNTQSNVLTPINNPHDIYMMYEWEGAPPSSLNGFDDKIVKVKIPSLQTIDATKFKAFIADLTAVAHKVTVVETEKYDGSSSLRVASTENLSLADVMSDYVEETVPDDYKEICREQLSSLFTRATEVKT